MAENLYRSKVLIENWFEDRSDHTNPSHSFFKELKTENPISYTLTTVNFVEGRIPDYIGRIQLHQPKLAQFSRGKGQGYLRNYLRVRKSNQINRLAIWLQKLAFIWSLSSEYKNPKEQTRNSKLNPFLLKKGCLEKDPAAMEEYRKKWISFFPSWLW